ncbi:uncharacterized protein LOC132923944 [Rhopalosiphum padi]|uniref:uncharacterized protein LOC132923944 n=1 Tax=Rhopalosiphum padi TaxID=40932 RepID=UPI00298E6368|nr:uncharacterized protein LOC132923944 [Rhopalosiphum padi]
MYNMHQAIDDYKGYDLKEMMELKIDLIKLNIIKTYIDLINLQIKDVISEDGLQIINNKKYINKNVVYAIDIEFKTFINRIENFWMQAHFDLNFENPVYPTIQHDCKVIYLDSERTVKFVLQSTKEFHDVNYNELLVVACLKTYFSNAVKPHKSTLNNIYQHIEIIKVITKFQFINKKYLKTALQNLINQQYIHQYSNSNYTIYKPADNVKIESLISKFKYIEMIHVILNITEEIYLTTAIKYELSSSVYNYTNIPRSHKMQENKCMDNVHRKVLFIKKFLNSITLNQHTTIGTVHNTFKTKLTTYKQLLHTVLNRSPESPINYIVSTDELLEYHTNSNLQLPSPIPSTTTSKYLKQSLQTSDTKFYTRRSGLQDYLEKYYN